MRRSKMTGKVRAMIDQIVEQRSHGNATIRSTTRTKLILKGIDVDSFTHATVDDPTVIEKLKLIAKDMNITFEGGR